MNNYIIDPKWFYWIDVSDKGRILILFIAIISISCTVLLLLFSTDICYNEEDVKFLRKLASIAGVVSAVSAIIFIFLPSKETLIQMKIAEFATYENAELTIDTIKSATDYIIDAIKTLKE